jgi:hypothetical protein
MNCYSVPTLAVQVFVFQVLSRYTASCLDAVSYEYRAVIEKIYIDIKIRKLLRCQLELL